jgi:hypothetical protein
MTKQRLASWRVFTITVTLIAAFAGYALGTLTAESVGQHTAWHDGYSAALTHQGAHHDRP